MLVARASGRDMRRYLLLIPLVCVVGGCPLPFHPPTPAAPKLREEPKTGRSYWLYVPSYYSADREWPLVVTLHGTYGWDGPWRQAMEWKYVAEQHGLLVAAPLLRSVQGMLPTLDLLWFADLAKDEQLVLAMIDEISQKYRVDREAILLTGFSAGGYPLYYVGLRNPDRFHMLIARACNSGHKIFERVKVTDQARKLPVMIYWGRDDLGAIHKESWLAFRWLRDNGFRRAERHRVQGGHLRRPELAYRYWKPYLPDKYRKKPGAD